MQKLLKTYDHNLMQLSSGSKFCISPNSQYIVTGTKQGHICYLDLMNFDSNLSKIVKFQHKAPVVAVEW